MLWDKIKYGLLVVTVSAFGRSLYNSGAGEEMWAALIDNLWIIPVILIFGWIVYKLWFNWAVARRVNLLKIQKIENDLKDYQDKYMNSERELTILQLKLQSLGNDSPILDEIKKSSERRKDSIDSLH